VDAHLDDAAGKWALWSGDGLVHMLQLLDGTQAATFKGSAGALAGNRVYVANGRTITLRTMQ
jgi:hypothetical protein